MSDDIAVSLVAGGVAYGTPILFAGLGELLTERAGALNLGVEGMMLVGAASGFWASQVLPGPSWLVLVLALVIAGAAGAAMAAIFALVCLRWRADQVVAGLALAIFGGSAGLSSYFASVGHLSGQAGRHSFPVVRVPGLDSIPLVGKALFGEQTVLVYLSWAVLCISVYYLYFTRAGLNLRAVGEDPAAADAMGVNVVGYRVVHVILGGVLAGIGGSAYALALLPSWSNGMTAGAGWIAIGLVIVALWRPELLLVGCYVFGAILSLGFTLQNLGITLPPEFFSSLPYLATVLILVVVSGVLRRRRIGAPAALGRFFAREE